MVTKERTRMLPTTIEMCQVVRRNRKLIDLGQVREIEPSMLKSHYPTAPKVPGPDSNECVEEAEEEVNELSAEVG